MDEFITVEFEFCDECRIVTANGVDTPEQEQCAARIQEIWSAGWILTSNDNGEDEDGYFSPETCGGCGDTLAGDRFPAVATKYLHRV